MLGWIAFVIVYCVLQSVAESDVVSLTDQERKRVLRLSPLPPPPANSTNRVADDPGAAELGHRLFFDQGLSPEGVACATCHDPALGFADGKPLGEGVGKLTRHTPTLWNVAYQRWWFWDGRVDSLWAQALQPLEHPREMNAARVDVARYLSDSSLEPLYAEVFGPLPSLEDQERFPPLAKPTPETPGSEANLRWQTMAAADRVLVNRVMADVGKSLEAYQRRLVSRNSAFDAFAAALRQGEPPPVEFAQSAKRGLKLFVGKANCILCHSGPALSDGEFHNIRVPPAGGGAPADAGRYQGVQELKNNEFRSDGAYSDDPDGKVAQRLRFLTRKPEDWGAFRTPSLRNVALTAPYMHQGQFADLEEVVEYYSTHRGALPPGHHQQDRVFVPLFLSEQEKEDLIAFLNSLTDTSIDPKWLTPPVDD